MELFVCALTNRDLSPTAEPVDQPTTYQNHQPDKTNNSTK
jgi:hypothetical protein